MEEGKLLLYQHPAAAKQARSIERLWRKNMNRPLTRKWPLQQNMKYIFCGARNFNDVQATFGDSLNIIIIKNFQVITIKQKFYTLICFEIRISFIFAIFFKQI